MRKALILRQKAVFSDPETTNKNYSNANIKESVGRMSSKAYYIGFCSIYLVIVSLAIFTVHQRITTTLLGYEIGKLKSEEARLLKQKSSLAMELSKITTKDYLTKRTQKLRHKP